MPHGRASRGEVAAGPTAKGVEAVLLRRRGGRKAAADARARIGEGTRGRSGGAHAADRQPRLGQASPRGTTGRGHGRARPAGLAGVMSDHGSGGGSNFARRSRQAPPRATVARPARIAQTREACPLRSCGRGRRRGPAMGRAFAGERWGCRSRRGMTVHAWCPTWRSRQRRAFGVGSPTWNREREVVRVRRGSRADAPELDESITARAATARIARRAGVRCGGLRNGTLHGISTVHPRLRSRELAETAWFSACFGLARAALRPSLRAPRPTARAREPCALVRVGCRSEAAMDFEGLSGGGDSRW